MLQYLMYFSGKITNSFFTFLNQYELDTSVFFEITPLEIDFIRESESWMNAEQVEQLLAKIQHAYRSKFVDKDLVTTVGHNAPYLKSWGALDGSLSFFDSPKSFYAKIDKFLSYFILPAPLIYDKEDCSKFFSFNFPFPKKKYPIVQSYLQAVLEITPCLVGSEQTEVEWTDESRVKIYYIQEKTLFLPLDGIQKTDKLQNQNLILNIDSREIIDSRGWPALEVRLTLQGGVCAVGIVPSGASTGRFEAVELRDNDPKYFLSKGLKKACHNVKILSSILKDQDVQNQEVIDHVLIKQDSHPQKAYLGANTLLGVSLASLRAAAKLNKQALYKYAALDNKSCYLPVPLMNIVNGGRHGDNDLDIQEFMIVPVDFSSFQEALVAGCEIFHHLKMALKKQGYSTSVGDEGGVAPVFSCSEQVFDFILSSIEKASYSGRVALALDCAASEFFHKDHYKFENKKRSSDEMIAIYQSWVKQYPLASIEDALHEEDWSSWTKLTKTLGHQLQIVGDDLFVTQKHRVARGIAQKAANALLVKPNQVGTITETKEACLTARSGSFSCILSHRSGETEDTSIADLSVAWGTEQIKTGGLSRGERTAKYNRLTWIEKELGSQARFRGLGAFKHKIF